VLQRVLVFCPARCLGSRLCLHERPRAQFLRRQKSITEIRTTGVLELKRLMASIGVGSNHFEHSIVHQDQVTPALPASVPTPHLRRGRLQPYLYPLLQSRTSAFLRPLGCRLHRERFVDSRSSSAPLQYGTSDCLSLHQDPPWLEVGQPIGPTGDKCLRGWWFPTFRHGVLSHVKVIHGTFILSSTIPDAPCSAVPATLGNHPSIAFVNVFPGTRRFDVHRSPEVTSGQTGHECCFRGAFIFSGQSAQSTEVRCKPALGLSPLCPVESAGRNPGSSPASRNSFSPRL